MTGHHSHRITIGVGSNTPDAEIRISEALTFLETILTEMRNSHTYRTPAIGHKEAPDYTNMVVTGTSYLAAEALQPILKEYERRCGRTPQESAQGRVTIDLDIVIADDEILRPFDYNARHFRIGFEELNK